MLQLKIPYNLAFKTIFAFAYAISFYKQPLYIYKSNFKIIYILQSQTTVYNLYLLQIFSLQLTSVWIYSSLFTFEFYISHDLGFQTKRPFHTFYFINFSQNMVIISLLNLLLQLLL